MPPSQRPGPGDQEPGTTKTAAKTPAQPTGQTHQAPSYSLNIITQAKWGRRVSGASIRGWAGRPPVRTHLKSFKHDLVDHGKYFMHLKKKLGGDPAKWHFNFVNPTAEYVFRTKTIPEQDRDKKKASPEVYYRAQVYLLIKAISKSDVPGADRLNDTPDENFYRYRMASALLITVMLELQEGGEQSYFLQTLGGRGVEVFIKPRLPAVAGGGVEDSGEDGESDDEVPDVMEREVTGKKRRRREAGGKLRASLTKRLRAAASSANKPAVSSVDETAVAEVSAQAAHALKGSGTKRTAKSSAGDGTTSTSNSLGVDDEGSDEDGDVAVEDVKDSELQKLKDQLKRTKGQLVRAHKENKSLKANVKDAKENVGALKKTAVAVIKLQEALQLKELIVNDLETQLEDVKGYASTEKIGEKHFKARKQVEEMTKELKQRRIQLLIDVDEDPDEYDC